jgi:hypothetical protein
MTVGRFKRAEFRPIIWPTSTLWRDQWRISGRGSYATTPPPPPFGLTMNFLATCYRVFFLTLQSQFGDVIDPMEVRHSFHRSWIRHWAGRIYGSRSDLPSVDISILKILDERRSRSHNKLCQILFHFVVEITSLTSHTTNFTH